MVEGKCKDICVHAVVKLVILKQIPDFIIKTI